jgi:hypothetical protein
MGVVFLAALIVLAELADFAEAKNSPYKKKRKRDPSRGQRYFW